MMVIEIPIVVGAFETVHKQSENTFGKVDIGVGIKTIHTSWNT